MTTAPDPGILQQLQASYRAGRLEYIVGAGASISAGLPNWEDLNLGLLRLYLLDKYADLELTQADLEVAARRFVLRFGREAVVDVVREQLGRVGKDAAFQEMVRKTLYSRGPFKPGTLHYELAAAMKDSRKVKAGALGLHTFNYDTLLEKAVLELTGHDPERITSRESPSGRHVVHLHGLVPPEDPVDGTLVLSELDYHRAADDWVTHWFQETLNPVDDKRARDILMVGLSLTDPRLRRLLLDRLHKLQGREGPAQVFVMLTESQCGADDPLVERLAHNLIRRHETEYWSSWKIKVVPVKSHDLVPFYLRQIRLGSNGQEWTEAGAKFLREFATHYADVYTDSRQKEIQLVLKSATGFLGLLESRFAIPYDEEVHVGGFIPWGAPARLQLGFHFKGRKYENIVVESFASRRRLDVSDLSRPQGAAGHAFVTGAVTDVSRQSAALDAHFTAAMKKDWSGRDGRDKTFQALLCVPVYDADAWVPIGVAYVNSNFKEPFWRRMPVSDYLQLQELLRAMFREVLDYSRSSTGGGS